MIIDSAEKLTARVVRSSSCTVLVPELDLQVNPGSSSTGYVSNVEGVLNRFQEIINMVERDLASQFDGATDDERSDLMDQMATLQGMSLTLSQLGQADSDSITLELLDPHGHSMILHPDAVERDLSAEEIAALPVGPDPAVFSTDDVNESS
jgi:zinc finger protein